MNTTCYSRFAYATPDGSAGTLGIEKMACGCKDNNTCIAYLSSDGGVGQADCRLPMKIVCVRSEGKPDNMDDDNMHAMRPDIYLLQNYFSGGKAKLLYDRSRKWKIYANICFTVEPTLLLRQTVVNSTHYLFRRSLGQDMSMNADDPTAPIYSIIGGRDNIENYRSYGKQMYTCMLQAQYITITAHFPLRWPAVLQAVLPLLLQCVCLLHEVHPKEQPF